LSVGLSGKLRDDNLNGAVMFENSRHVFGSVSKGNFLIDLVKSVERIIDEIGTDLLEDKSEDARGIIPPALSQAHPICLIPSLILLPLPGVFPLHHLQCCSPLFHSIPVL
jgi:hypothetical protein